MEFLLTCKLGDHLSPNCHILVVPKDNKGLLFSDILYQIKCSCAELFYPIVRISLQYRDGG